jgi:hypothetical protein
VPDGRGGFYVGGNFNHVESTAYSSNSAVLIHINYDGSFDPSFVVQEMGYSSSVYACAFDASTSTLFLGGDFAQLSMDGTTFTPANALAAVTASTPSITNMGSVISASSPQVLSMDLDRVRNRLYVGGTFTLTGALTGNSNAAAFSSLAANSYAADPNWHPNPNGSVNAIYADAASFDGFVYIGGPFLSPQSYLFRTSASGAIGAGWNPGLAGTVYSIAKDSSNFYVSARDSGSVPHIYRIDAATATISGSPLLSASGTPDSFSSIALSSDGTQLYVGGKFLISGHQNLLSIAILSATAGTPAVNPNFNASTNSNTWVNTVATNAVGKLFVGGTFTSVGGVLRTNIAAIDLSTGKATEWTSPYHTIGPITAIESDGNYIYAGYDLIYNTLPPGVFKTSISSSATGYGNWSTGGTTTDHVLALNLQNSDLYVGGQFSTLNGMTGLRNIARLDAGSGTVSTWKPVIGSTSEPVTQIAIDGNRVILGGKFTTINTSTTMASLVAIDSSSGALSSWTDPGLTGGVDSMLIIPANTYSFAPNGAVLVGNGSGIKLVDPSGTVMTWTNAPAIAGKMSKTNKLVRSGDTLYIGGYASGVTGQALLAFDLVGQTFMTGFQPRIQNYNQVKSIEVFDHGIMLVGGDFQQVRVNAADGSGGMMDWGLGLFNAGTGEFY